MTKLDLVTTGFVALPARADFLARYRKGEPQVVWARLSHADDDVRVVGSWDGWSKLFCAREPVMCRLPSAGLRNWSRGASA